MQRGNPAPNTSPQQYEEECSNCGTIELVADQPKAPPAVLVEETPAAPVVVPPVVEPPEVPVRKPTAPKRKTPPKKAKPAAKKSAKK